MLQLTENSVNIFVCFHVLVFHAEKRATESKLEIVIVLPWIPNSNSKETAYNAGLRRLGKPEYLKDKISNERYAHFCYYHDSR